MSLRLKDPNTIPEDGFRYPHVAPGLFITGFNYSLFYPKIVEVYTANGKQPPTEQEVVDWMCREMYIPCFDGTTPLVNKFTMNLPPPAPTSCCGGRNISLPKGVK